MVSYKLVLSVGTKRATVEVITFIDLVKPNHIFFVESVIVSDLFHINVYYT